MEEITAEYAANQLAPAQALRVRTRVSLACKTDLGRVRENNEDKFEYFVPEDEGTLASRGQVFVVCDGMGGHAAGQIASELTAKTFIDVYLHHPSESETTAMEAAVMAANRFVLDNARAFPQRRGMGTTLSALILLQDRAWVVQVGDSRVYRLRDGELEMLSHDHTFVEESVRMGTMSREEAEAHPYKHVLTRAIGVEDGFRPDIDPFDLRQGDLYLLCSDGLINHVGDEQITDILRSNCPSEAAWKLVGAALLGGGSDNATVLIVRVDEMVSDGLEG
ncbi:MAG TPA: Stp1/IreP family PP2C-type Ser/Thr phosphatase [Fimbriimonas sp.]